jgi:N-acetylglucosamine-6-phosphate deacetylase
MEPNINNLKDKTGSFNIEAIHYITGRRVRLEVIEGVIADIREIELKKNENESLIIAPGLIDNQINGFANVDFSGENLSVEDVVKAAEAIWRGGVTTFLPTLVTNSNDLLIKNFRILNKACKLNDLVNKSIPGFHLEGPYISPEEGFRGCHPIQYIHNPSWEEFLSFQDAAGGRIIQVTIAPEIEGAMDFIRRCSKEGIVIGIGHTAASAEQIKEAVDNGARLSTHLGNGCANLIHRHHNPLWAQLADDRLKASIIADGLHLLPQELQVFYKVKGAGNIILISDVIYLAGMSPGKYRFLGAEVLLTDEGMLLNTESNCLAGASFPLRNGVENMAKLTDCSLWQAINMASANVARLLNLKNRGSLELGKRADLMLYKGEGRSLLIKNIWLNGELVF